MYIYMCQLVLHFNATMCTAQCNEAKQHESMQYTEMVDVIYNMRHHYYEILIKLIWHGVNADEAEID